MMKRLEPISELFWVGKVISGGLEDFLTKFIMLEMDADQAEICAKRLTAFSRNSQFPSDYGEVFFPKRLHAVFQDYLVGKIQFEDWDTARKNFEARKEGKVKVFATLELWRKYADFEYSDEEWDEILRRLEVDYPGWENERLWKSFVKGEIDADHYMEQLKKDEGERCYGQDCKNAPASLCIVHKCLRCCDNPECERHRF
jgi:hypothetical protein